MTEPKILHPTEAARKLGVPTREIIEAMYYKRVPRVRLDDGTLGIPEDALEAFAAKWLTPPSDLPE